MDLENIKNNLKKIFEGRLNRKPYIIRSVVLWVVMYTIYLVMQSYMGDDGMPIANFLILPLLIVAIALTVRRLHDLNFSGWWAFLLLVFSVHQIAQYIVLLMLSILFVIKGSEGTNLYGKDPLQ